MTTGNASAAPGSAMEITTARTTQTSKTAVSTDPKQQTITPARDAPSHTRIQNTHSSGPVRRQGGELL